MFIFFFLFIFKGIGSASNTLVTWNKKQLSTWVPSLAGVHREFSEHHHWVPSLAAMLLVA